MKNKILQYKGSFHLAITIAIFIFSFIVLLQELKFKKLQAMENTEQTKDRLYLKLKEGIVVIETFPDIAPKHVTRIKELVRQGFYNGNQFFRVIDRFVAQTGDPTNTGRNGSGKTLPAEFSKVPFKRGVLGMARAADVNSADSQFFIVLQDSDFLNEKYTVWGRVISGMEYVDKIKKSKVGSSGIVEDPDSIIDMQLVSDIQKSI
jgi:peptidylprolyl isomerase